MQYSTFSGLSGVTTRLAHPDGPAATSAASLIDGPLNEGLEQFVHAVLMRDIGYVGEAVEVPDVEGV